VSFGAPHDEHRLLIPRIVIIASMFAFKGDYRMPCCISFLVVEIISLCFLWLLIRLNVECFGVWVTWLFANIACSHQSSFKICCGPCSLLISCPTHFLLSAIRASHLWVGARGRLIFPWRIRPGGRGVSGQGSAQLAD
jgi:hypothetical protein